MKKYLCIKKYRTHININNCVFINPVNKKKFSEIKFESKTSYIDNEMIDKYFIELEIFREQRLNLILND